MCRCTCGRTRDIRRSDLVKGQQSCGLCVNPGADVTRKHGEASTGHETPEYRSWCAMKRRCGSTREKDYHNYGGRGITVCERWLKSFEAFKSDMGERPTPRHTLERDDNDGPYSPQNCRWATPKDQARNRRTNRRLTYAGETLTVADWARRLGVSRDALYRRIYSGWSTEDVLCRPMRFENRQYQ